MRIALISTLASPIRQQRSGSIEAVVWLLTRELTRLGHQVTVFGVDGSETSGEAVATLPGPYGTAGSPGDWHLCEWINLCKAVARSREFDVLHSHAYLWGIPLVPLAAAPMVHTLHIVPDDDHARLRLLAPEACVTAISAYQWSEFPDLPPAPVVHHGVDDTQFTFRVEPDDYLCFIGRFMPGKGPLAAIHAARALGIRLLLAGPRNEYYERHLAPLVDGKQVEFVGWVHDTRRDALLGGARALLYPLQDPEPFGLVMLEAMMCGTPVAAMGIGAVPEIIDAGATGCYTRSPEKFCDAVLGALALDRRRVREVAKRRFSADRMARDYLRLYERSTHAARASVAAAGVLLSS